MVYGNSKGEGVLKAKIVEAKYEAKLEFPGGWGARQITFHGGIWIFYGNAQYVNFKFNESGAKQLVSAYNDGSWLCSGEGGGGTQSFI